jgi:hypothetical protein
MFMFSLKYYASASLPASHAYCKVETAVTYLLIPRYVTMKSTNLSYNYTVHRIKDPWFVSKIIL